MPADPAHDTRRVAAGFARTWARSSVRRRWPGLLGITVLLGVIGGIALLSLAGARRTQSAYPRFLASKNPSTMAIDVGSVRPDSDGAAALTAIATMPKVRSARAYTAFYVAEWVDGAPLLDHDFEALGSLDGRFFDQDVVTALDGRLPDPTRPDEVLVNERAAERFGYHVGQRIDLATVAEEDLEQLGPDDVPTPRMITHATIVGVGVFVEEVVQDDTDRSTLMLMTPAFSKAAKGLETYAWDGVVLHGGQADVAAVKAEIIEKSGPSSPQIFRESSIDVFHAEQAIRPISLALATFGAIAALAAMVLVAQAVARQIRGERQDRDVARALGAGPRTIALVSSIGSLAAIVGGAAVAFVVAMLASPVMPIGPVRRVEVRRGIDVDWTVLGGGALVFVVVLAAVTAVVAWREQPHRVQRRAALRPSRTRSIAGRTGSLPVSVSTGLRLAYEPGDGATAVPVRSVMIGTAIAIASLVAAITFGAGMRHLLDNPHQYGWNWDVALLSGGGYGNTDERATEEVLGSDPDVAGYSGAYFGADTIDGTNLPMIAMQPSSSVLPPIRSGRMIRDADEIVLGTATIEQLHKRVGDTVSSSAGPLRIVGTATLPTVSQVHGDHTSLGIGAIVDRTRAPGWDRNCGDGSATSVAEGECGPNIIFVRYRSGAVASTVTTRLSEQVQRIDSGQNGIAVLPPQRAGEIVNADEIRGSSTLLGGAVAVASLVALAVALTSAVRRRRRELALLKSLGFTRRQISGAVAWQATGTVAAGILLGVPGGVLIGRALWSSFADQLDVVADPVTPVAACAVVVLGALVAANVLAAIPARFARAVPAALVLRQE